MDGVAVDVAQQEHNNNKCYNLVFRYRYRYRCIWLEVGGCVSWKFLFFLMWVANMDNSGFFERN